MSRSYNLRNRSGAGVATQSERALNESPSLIDVDTHSNEVAPQDEGSTPVTKSTGPVRLYSDAVALRPPSPRREKLAQPSGKPVRDLDTKVPERTSEVEGSREEDGSQNEGDSSSKEVETPDKVEYPSWTTVKRRRARSEGSLQYKKPLTSEQANAVKRAAEGLTAEQKQKILRRQEKVRSRRDASVSSRGEGPSKPKGKAIDPREWGNVDFSRENLDVEAQAAALKTFKAQAKTAKEHSKKSRLRDKRVRSSKQDNGQREQRSSKKVKASHRPPEAQPAAQIAPRSYLGNALQTIRRSRGPRTPSEPSSSSSSSSSSSESSIEPSSSQSGDETSSDDDSDDSYQSGSSRGKRRRDSRHGRNKSRKKRPRSSSRKTTIKPIPPKEYDGAADVRAYHRFVRESDAYLRDGKVRGLEGYSFCRITLPGEPTTSIPRRYL